MKKAISVMILFLLVGSIDAFAVSINEANQSLSDASMAIDRMKNAGFNVSIVTYAYENATLHFEEGNYEKVSYFTKIVLDNEKEAFFVHTLIDQVDSQIKNKSTLGYDTRKARKLLNRANLSFNRGLYYEAESFANDALLALHVSRRPIHVVLLRHWFLVLSIVIALGILIDFSRPLIKKAREVHRLFNLKKEKMAINRLIHEANSKYYHERIISKKEYEHLVAQYNKKLKELEKLEKELKNKLIKRKKK